MPTWSVLGRPMEPACLVGAHALGEVVGHAVESMQRKAHTDAMDVDVQRKQAEEMAEQERRRAEEEKAKAARSEAKAIEERAKAEQAQMFAEQAQTKAELEATRARMAEMAVAMRESEREVERKAYRVINHSALHIARPQLLGDAKLAISNLCCARISMSQRASA